jgi:hypothetical protein
MKKMKKFDSIEKAMKEGYDFHAFLSGGRLRVLTLRKAREDDCYYGESANFTPAFNILIDDVKAGGRPYDKVYGPKETHYWTGAYADPADPVDVVLWASKSINASFQDGKIEATIDIYEEFKTPKVILEKAGETFRPIHWRIFGGDKTTFTTTPQRDMMGGLCFSTDANKKDYFKEDKIKRITANGLLLLETLKEAAEKTLLEIEKEPEWYETPLAD